MRALTLFAAASIVLGLGGPAHAGPTGKLQGRIVGTDDGEPIGFADIALLPADTTLRRVGMLTNADGTYLMEAAPGRYTLQIRAISYATRRVEGIEIVAGRLTPFDTALRPEAIQQEEIVVEAKARTNTESSLLAARKKAASLGDAVSAEQVRRSPDKDGAEVLRRVTGLSVTDGKYVFVRGLGERYSSTEVDGVRIASPEQNKRVVPLDLLPAALLDHITVQKTYTADRPGEFGGGDVQVKTRDFPGARTISVSMSQSFAEGVTFKDRLSYVSTGADVWGFGARARRVPDAVDALTGGRKLAQSDDPTLGFSKAMLAEIGRTFENVWTPAPDRNIPNGTYGIAYGDEFKLLGRPLGVIQSWNYSRVFDHEASSARSFNDRADTLYDYAVTRDVESVQLGGVSGLSLRLSPRHTLSLRGLYTNSADDEVRIYQGADHNRQDGLTGTYLRHRATRLMYTQRSILSGTLGGSHEIRRLLGARLDWKLTGSEARRQQPDRRETIYDLKYYPGNVTRWVLGSQGVHEFGDLKDFGRGGSVSTTVPYRLGPLGNGKLAAGYDHDTKRRFNYYRRFNLYAPTQGSKSKTPEEIFADSTFNVNSGTAYVEETTLSVDNYRARQRLNAGYLSADVPFGRRLRGTFGVRVEKSLQEVISYDLFFPDIVTQEGRLEDADWMPSGNLTWGPNDAINLRAAASRTVSRPDLNELSSSPALEYVGGYQVAGNPNLKRARIDNYDLRLEVFPDLSEVLAAGVFYKDMHEPIEQQIQGGSPNLLIPRNSDRGRNYGLELEARFGLGRAWGRLKALSVNSNATWVRSNVRLKERVTRLGSDEHPLQGQADVLANAALTYSLPRWGLDSSVLFGLTGRRLVELGEGPLGDTYEQPTSSLDATTAFAIDGLFRVKLAGKNLTDPLVRRMHGALEESSTRKGRSYSIALSYPGK